jgi:hypothetical protein
MSNPAEATPYYGDLEKTQMLSKLFDVPRDARDSHWQSNVIEHLSEASFRCGDPQVMTGPGGFPYFQLFIPEANQPFECYVLSHMVDDFLFERGWGVVINLKDNQPDWLLTYGDVVNYKLRKEFYSPPPEAMPPSGIIEKEEEVLTGQPSETLFPQPLRNALRQYLVFHGHKDVKILLMSRHRPEGIVQQIVFNLTVDQFVDEPSYQALMQSLAWFMPGHYSYGAMDEKDFAGQFSSL